MNREIKLIIKGFLEQLKDVEIFSKTEFIILYGSSLSSYHLDDSDVDICIYVDEEKKKLPKIRLDLLKKFNEKLDIQIFQLLPLYVQIEVLKGEILYVKEKARLYEIADETIEEYEDFYPLYLDYINR